MAACEVCGAPPTGYKLWDYCAHCSKTLCDNCAAKGHCGRVPADSGMEVDFGERGWEEPTLQTREYE